MFLHDAGGFGESGMFAFASIEGGHDANNFSVLGYRVRV